MCCKINIFYNYIYYLFFYFIFIFIILIIIYYNILYYYFYCFLNIIYCLYSLLFLYNIYFILYFLLYYLCVGWTKVGGLGRQKVFFGDDNTYFLAYLCLIYINNTDNINNNNKDKNTIKEI